MRNIFALSLPNILILDVGISPFKVWALDIDYDSYYVFYWCQEDNTAGTYSCKKFIFIIRFICFNLIVSSST